MVAASLFTFFLSLAVAAAKPLEQAASFTKLLLTKRTVTGSRNIVNMDRLRVNNIIGHDIFDVISTSAENVNASVYLATVGVGCPPTNCKWSFKLQRLVDDQKFLTGSSIHRQPRRWHGKVSESVLLPHVWLICMIHHSANTWIGAGTPYVKTSTSHRTNDSFVSGLEFVYALSVSSYFNLNSLLYME